MAYIDTDCSSCRPGGPGSAAWYDDLWTSAGLAYSAAQRLAFPDGEYIGQQGYMAASEIAGLAVAAGAARETAVLDVCCGPGGPAVMLAGCIGCRVIGVDRSEAAIRRAGQLALRSKVAPDAQFLVAGAPSLPFADGSFRLVVLLETWLAFVDKKSLLCEIARVLAAGGRFAFSAESGGPLSRLERRLMPGGEEMTLTSEKEIGAFLGGAGFCALVVADVTSSHARVAGRLAEALRGCREALSAELGVRTYEDLQSSASTWSGCLANGRVRKLLYVAGRETSRECAS